MWVFGIADTSRTPAITYMQTVDKRDAATLLPIIQKVVRPSSTVVSDEWAAYRKIQQQLNLDHQTVNHSMNFVDPDTGAHTQNIESYWAKTKYKFKVMKGVSTDALPSYLDERMWRPLGQHYRRSIYQYLFPNIRAVPFEEERTAVHIYKQPF
jgi:transposase-like protein